MNNATNNMNLNLLKFFIAAAESNSLAEAGEKLGYSASTVSTSISTLENQLGVQLFARKPLMMTEIGQDIYKTVKNGMSDLDFAMTIAESGNNIDKGRISIGCLSHITEFFLMEKIALAIKDYPNLHISLDTESGKRELIEELKKNKLDFIILDGVRKEFDSELEVKELKTIDSIFISKEKIVINDLKELTNYNYILSYPNKTFNVMLMEILKKYGINELKTSLSCPTTEPRVWAAKSGIGIAYVLKDAAKEAIDKKEVYEVKLPIELPKTTVRLIYLKNHLTKVDKEFIKKYLLT